MVLAVVFDEFSEYLLMPYLLLTELHSKGDFRWAYRPKKESFLSHFSKCGFCRVGDFDLANCIKYI